MSFAITLYDQCCRHQYHFVRQHVMRDVSVVRSCWSIEVVLL